MKKTEVSENINSKKVSYKVSLGGIVAALCLTLMFLTAVFPPLNMTLPLFAGVLISVVAIEISPSWALVTYIVVAILSFFITPDKEAAIFFSALFGYYPVLKDAVDKMKAKLIAWLIKLAVFDAAMILIYYITIYVLGTLDIFEEFGFLGDFMIPVLFIAISLIYVLYDYCLTVIKEAYIKWFRPTFLRKFK